MSAVNGGLIDHIGLVVSDAARSLAFYKAALAPLGLVPLAADGDWCGMGPPGGDDGRGGEPVFWFGPEDHDTGAAHVALRASNRAQVEAFHCAGLRAGGHDNGAPGLRPDYGVHYFAAFLLDPDGHNIEAVCRLPESPHGQ